MKKKMAGGKAKAPAAPVPQRQGIYHYFDKQQSEVVDGGYREPQRPKVPKEVPDNELNTRPRPELPNKVSSPPCSPPKPINLINKRLAKVAELDIDNFNSSQIEWQDNGDAQADVVFGTPGAAQRARTAFNKQRLMEAQAGQPRPAVPSDPSSDDQVLEEALAGLGAVAGGGDAAAAGAGAANALADSPAGETRPFRTPATGHRPAGIMRHANRLRTGRFTPSSVAFKALPGAQTSGRLRRSSAGGAMTTTTKKRKQQLSHALDSIVGMLETGAMDAPAAEPGAAEPALMPNDVVGPVGLARAAPGSPPPKEPPSQRPRPSDWNQQQKEQQNKPQGERFGLPGAVVDCMQRTFTDWEKTGQPAPANNTTETRQAPAPAGAPEAPNDGGFRPLPTLPEDAPAVIPVEQQQNQPAAAPTATQPQSQPQLEAGGQPNGEFQPPPPSPYVPNAPPSHRRETADVARAAMEQAAAGAGGANAGLNQVRQALDWGESEDEDDLALIEELERQHRAKNAPAAPSTAATIDGSAEAAPPALAGDRAFVHYRVLAMWNLTGGNGQPETQLQLQNPYSGLQVIAHLQSPWDYSNGADYRINDPVNLIVPQLDDFGGQMHCMIGGPQGDPRALLVHYPDVLLGGTRVAGSTQCIRQGFLQERIAGSDGTNAACTKGNMYHSLFQSALQKGTRNAKALQDHAREIIASRTLDLLDSEMTEEQAFDFLKESIPRTISMLNRLKRENPLPSLVLSAGHVAGNEIKRHAAIPEVLDIEEYISAPKYGLKGYVDSSIMLKLQPVQAPGAPPLPTEVVVAPLELKTGMSRPSDVAQVLLYLLAMEERYGHPLNWGLLINSNPRSEEPHRLVAREDHVLAILMAARNKLAAALARNELPALADSKSGCNRCFARTECMLSHAALEHAGQPKQVVSDKFAHGMLHGRDRDNLLLAYEMTTGHLSLEDQGFLRKWSYLLDLESNGPGSIQRPEIWAMTGEAREAAGRCVSGLTIVSSTEAEGRWIYTFAKSSGEDTPCPFPQGEMLMLGVDGKHAGIGRGHLLDSTSRTLTVVMEKELREGLLFPNGREAAAIATSAAGAAAAPQLLCDPRVSWRLDKEEVGTTAPRMRGFLYSLFARSFDQQGREEISSTRAHRLRELVVQLAPPTPPPAAMDRHLAAAVDAQVAALKLNAEQAAAVRAAVSAQDYCLVLGMPGAGKTTAIVAMIHALAAAGKRVLLTSYTNSAVDNVLLKLAASNTVPFVRVGRQSRVAPGLQDWTPYGARYAANSPAELAKLVDTVNVWGVSALGATDPLIRRRQFDVCIVDEAGQITLPATLGPLLRARSFVLVGDPHQLPPLVQNDAAAEQGLAEPLFARLAAAHPSAVVALPVQYRMAEDIQVLPNILTYNGQLRCGCPKIASAQLEIPRWPLPILPPAVAASQRAQNAPWVHQVLDPARRVVFVDTSMLPAPEVKLGETITNPTEAELVLTLVNAAVRAGVSPGAFGLISPYNRQVSLLQRLTRSQGVEAAECLTIDKAQGRDKDCIIVSLVKSNAEKETGKLLADSRRVNVAITRAKVKLILVGDANTLRTLPLFARVLEVCEQQEWVTTVP